MTAIRLPAIRRKLLLASWAYAPLCISAMITMGGWKDLATMKNIYIHTQDEDLEIARAILTSSKS